MTASDMRWFLINEQAEHRHDFAQWCHEMIGVYTDIEIAESATDDEIIQIFNEEVSDVGYDDCETHTALLAQQTLYQTLIERFDQKHPTMEAVREYLKSPNPVFRERGVCMLGKLGETLDTSPAATV